MWTTKKAKAFEHASGAAKQPPASKANKQDIKEQQKAQSAPFNGDMATATSHKVWSKAKKGKKLKPQGMASGMTPTALPQQSV